MHRISEDSPHWEKIENLIEGHSRDDEHHFGRIDRKIDRMMKHVRTWGLIGGFIGGLSGLGVHALESLTGCSPGIPGRPNDEQIVSLHAEESNCVLAYETRPEVDACRATVRARWCVTFPQETNCTKDGGR